MTEDEMYDIIRCYEDSERDYHELNIELENENAKLRELVADMLVTVRAAWCLGVDVGKVAEYERRAHELGIEVEG